MGKRVRQLQCPGPAIGVGVPENRTMGLARNDLRVAKLAGSMLDHIGDQKRPIHHEAELVHCGAIMQAGAIPIQAKRYNGAKGSSNAGLHMSAVTQSAGPRLPQTSGEGAVREWLELLANGGCDQSAFLQSMSLRFQSEPDGSWEVLSQLDQYYRRGKIKPEVFREINAAICASALGAGDALPRAQPNTKTSQPPAAPEPKPGDTLRSRYRLESILGRGRQGCVFEALDEYRLDVPSCGQRIAVKVLHGEVASRTELLSALRRDFQQLQSLSHPNIVRVYEFDRDGPFAFFTMELLNGAPLTRVL